MTERTLRIKRTNHESLLISAMLNGLDALMAKSYGITAQHFQGYRDQYEWILSFNDGYKRCPRAEEFLTKYPTFPHDHNADDPLFPATELKRKLQAEELVRRCQMAGNKLERGQLEEAWAELADFHLEVVSEKPQNLLVDHSYLDDYDRPTEERVRMPWESLQKATNGIGPGELWYLGARQGQGKSALLIEMAAEAVMNGKTVCFYSLEMTKRQVQARMHATLGRRLNCRVDAKAMLHRTFDKGSYKTLLQKIEDNVPGQMVIHEAAMGRVSPGVVANRAQDYDLNIVDYVGLMYTDDGRPAIKDWREMAEISNQLKEIALSKSARIIGASQINREGDTHGRRPPRLKTLAQSDHLGNDGDVVLTMKRYGLATVLSAEKNRHGEAERLFYTNFLPNDGDFREIDADTAEERRLDAEMD